MSDVTTHDDSSLVRYWLDDRHELRQRVARRRRRATRAWFSSVLDKIICGASIALLAPAILAVWVAIKRSTPTRSPVHSAATTVIGRDTQAEVQAAEPSVLLTIKPVLTCDPQEAGTMQIAAKRAMSA